MSTDKRVITYGQAIAEATVQAMEADKQVFVAGIGVTDYKGIFGTTIKAHNKFGPGRVMETPASENAMTGIAIGASVAGKKPILVHARNDFMFLTLDQMINNAAKWKYTYGGKSSVNITVRGIIGKGWGQGPTHSQSIQAMLVHSPGIYTAMPSTPHDVKGLLMSAVRMNVPCVILEHRALYNIKGHVPRGPYRLAWGRGRTVVRGNDVTIVAVSYMVQEAVKAAMCLKKLGVSAEVIDPRTINPLDTGMIFRSVRKTGRLVVADTGHVPCGFAGEVAALAQESCFKSLKAPVARIGMPACPCPVSKELEDAFYPTYKDIYIKCCGALGRRPDRSAIMDRIIDDFKGPY